MHLAQDGETSSDESLSSNFQLLPGAGEPSTLGPEEMSPHCCLWLRLQELEDETRRQWVRWLSRASFITKPCGLALQGALHRDQGLQTQAEAFLWGLEGGMGSCNPGILVGGGGLIYSPDSFILKESRMPAWCRSILELPGI